MMTLVERPRARRYHHPVQKDSVTFLRTGDETGGEYTLIEVEVAPGGGTIPHYHRTYAEHFEVLDGTLTVRVGGEVLELRPGERAVAPARSLHCFRNHTAQPVRFLVRLSPASPGFENSLRVGYGLAADGRTLADGTPRNPLHLAVLLQWSEIRLPGIRTALEPAFAVLARLARRLGVDRRLLERYAR